MASPTSVNVVLAFGDSRVEIDAAVAQRRGGLRAFIREAEQRLGLRSGTFGFYDRFGKVDSPESLQRALHGAAASGEAACHLEVRENGDGRIMREMHAAMQAFEARIFARVDEAIEGAKRDLEPAIRDLAAEQQRLHSRIDAVSEEALAARLDALSGEEALVDRLNSLDRELECLRAQDFGGKLDSVVQDCLAMREDALAGEDAITRRLDEMDAAAKQVGEAAEAAAALRQLEALEEELSRDFDLQVEREEIDLVRREADVATASAEVSALEPRPTAAVADASRASQPSVRGAAPTTAATPAYLLDLCGQDASPSRTGDSRSTFADSSGLWGRTSLASAGFSFSGKAAMADFGDKKQQRWTLDEKASARLGGFGPAMAAPFAQPKLRACRSSPLLPPLR
eukprot:TRINITY_DN13281_c0_g1_i1.p1 TRINITY_DN13281_c0_g1~~TRINITY_DN13281_c0_g1_i1.p1  ORF type:complete len:424 (+),score=113.16 TRINITY_DN13281_c0_g1_i1:77-1273(+)